MLARSFRSLVFAVWAAGLAAFAAPLWAQAPAKGPGKAQPYVDVRLALDHEAVAPGDHFTIALRETITPGWHTYWRNPGDSGEPIHIEWQSPPGFAVGAIQWPLPRREPLADLVNYGYSGQAVLLMDSVVPKSAKPGFTAHFAAKIGWLVCADICVPESTEAVFDLPIAAASRLDAKAAPEFAAARAALPTPSPRLEARLAKTASGARLSIAASDLAQAAKRGALRELYFFTFDNEMIAHNAVQAAHFGSGGVALDLSPGAIPEKLGAGPIEGLLVVDEGGRRRGFEITAPLGPVLPASAEQSLTLTAASAPGKAAAAPAIANVSSAGKGASIGFAAALGLAFLAGLVLNLMPCVFPVLFVKAIALAQAGAEKSEERRRHGLLYALGVMATFALLGLGLSALRAQGAAIGWGYQLQSPLTIAGLMLLMTAIGLNLFGFFEIAGGFQNFGAGLARQGGAWGAFFTGALTVLVASPCLAPGMGAALGFALANPPLIGLAVFLSLGLGLALPFTGLSFFPGLRRLLPKPGRWMEQLKQFFAFPMFLTALWLLWVLAQQVDADGVAGALLALLALVFAIWLLKNPATGAARYALSGLAIAALVGGGLALAPLASPPSPSAGAGATGARSALGASPLLTTHYVAAEPWDRARIAALAAAGQPVFVDFTAAWCATCRVNSAHAIDRPAVAAAFKRAKAVLMVADWTKRDEAIAAELARFGRPGVPLYLVYRPEAPDAPRILPQFLSEGMVIAAIEGRGLSEGR